MTEDDLKKFLEDNSEEIKRTIKQKMVERLMQDHSWELSKHIGKVVSDFVAAEIVPDVQTHLMSMKGEITAACVKSLAKISDDLASSLAKDAAENIGTGYKRTQILKAIFGY